VNWNEKGLLAGERIGFLWMEERRAIGLGKATNIPQKRSLGNWMCCAHWKERMCCAH